MPYTKVGPWVNGAAPALSAPNLDHMETQYDEAVAEDLVFTELTSGAHNVVGVGAWENWDVSALVPAGTAYVVVLIEQIVAALVSAGARDNGSALGRTYTVQQRDVIVLPTEVDANRILEIYDGNAAPGINFYIVGYWS